MPRLIGPGFLTALIVAALLASGGQALASHVQCGDVITQDTTLDSDLIDCPREGIVIGADGITLDLNGHVVDGTGRQIHEDPCRAGIVVGWNWTCPRASEPTPDRVVIRGGAVRDFDFGVELFGTENSRVSEVAASGGFGGISVEFAPHTVIAKNQVARNEFGVVLGDVTKILVSHNLAYDNVAGIGGEGVDDSRFEHNLLMGNVHGVILHSIERSVVAHNHAVHNDVGFDLDDGVFENLVFGNTAAGNRGWGILMQEGVHGNRIEGNAVLRNATGAGGLDDGVGGIFLGDGHGNRISRNRVMENGGAAVVLEYNVSHAVIAANHVARNRGHGIVLGSDQVSYSLVERNRLLGNGADGIHLEAGLDGADSLGNVVRRNVAAGNADDGVQVASILTRIAANTVVRNSDLGIEAVAGVIDGGGNRAAANGNPLQCVNVFCR